MKKILLSSMLSLLSLSLWAVTASPYPFEMTLPDGSTMMVKLVGDEYHAYYTTVDGTPLRLLDNGFFVEDHTVKEKFAGIAAQRRANDIRNRANAASTFPTTGSPKSLVLLVGFKDLPFSQTREDFNNQLNQSGYDYNGSTGSCRDYFIASSDSLFQPQFDVYGPYTVSGNMADYGAESGGNHDKDPYSMVVDACMCAAEDGVDFSQYDTNNDGILDNVFVYYAGYNQAEGGPANSIWPHKASLSWKNVKVDGKYLATYACTSEYSGNGGKVRANIGTFCHEFGHVLGLADLYVTDNTAPGNTKLVPGSWALMSNGNYLNNGNTPPNLSAWEKYYLGWVEPEMLYANEHVVLPADGKTYRQLNRTGAVSADGPLTTDTTYYLENRQMTGWDAYLPGHGMLVWRVVYDADDWYYNMPNNNTTRFQLITANGSTPYTNNLNGGARQDVPFPGDWEYTEYAPYAHTQLSNIQEQDGVISFDFTNTTYTNVQSPSVEMDMTEGVWYNLLGQPVDVRSYKGVVISQQGKALLR